MPYKPTHSANLHLVKFAKQLTRNMTMAEKLLWVNVLSAKKLGVKFTKQKIFGSYIADFYCHSLRLVIEVDGESHKEKINDIAKTEFLKSLGLHVLRVTKEHVLKNITETANYIKTEVERLSIKK